MTKEQDNQVKHKWHSIEAGDVVEKLKTRPENWLGGIGI
jgi:hypothetical protein